MPGQGQKEIVIMASMSRFKMSQERLDAIKAELNYLETVREKERQRRTEDQRRSRDDVYCYGQGHCRGTS